jgi:hypothetical protein
VNRAIPHLYVIAAPVGRPDGPPIAVTSALNYIETADAAYERGAYEDAAEDFMAAAALLREAPPSRYDHELANCRELALRNAALAFSLTAEPQRGRERLEALVPIDAVASVGLDELRRQSG